jgi:hypothetical protein
MLQIRYHANFKFRPTLLFAGSASDVCRLLEVFRDWDGEEIDLLQRLRQVEGGVACDSVASLKLSRAKAEKDSYLEWTNDHGVWWISRRGQPRIVDLLEGLKDSADPGHQYLDIGDPTGVQIMCSKDEYPSKLPTV